MILSTAQVLMHTPVPTAFCRHRQKDQRFMVNLGCIDHSQPTTIWNLVLGTVGRREREEGEEKEERGEAEEKARMLIREVITPVSFSLEGEIKDQS